MNNRIYNDKVDVNNDNIREFYNKRAQKFIKGEKNQYTSVLLGDNNPEYAKKWDEFEKNYVGKYLNLGTDKKFLDIGCGIGRWAENVIDKCGQEKDLRNIPMHSLLILLFRIYLMMN